MQQQKDQRKTSRHNDGQALTCGGEVLELPAPVEPSPGGKFHVRVDPLAHFADEPGEVAVAHVALRHYAAFAILATHLKRLLGLDDVRQFAQWQNRWDGGIPTRIDRQKDRQLHKRGRLPPIGLGQPHDDVEPTVAVEHLPRRAAADRDVDSLDHFGGIQPVTRHRPELGPHSQFRHAGGLLHVYVDRTGDAAHHGSNFLRDTPQLN